MVESNGWWVEGYQGIWGTHTQPPKPFSALQTSLQTKLPSYLGHIEAAAEQKIGPNLDLAAAGGGTKIEALLEN